MFSFGTRTHVHSICVFALLTLKVYHEWSCSICLFKISIGLFCGPAVGAEQSSLCFGYMLLCNYWFAFMQSSGLYLEGAARSCSCYSDKLGKRERKKKTFSRSRLCFFASFMSVLHLTEVQDLMSCSTTCNTLKTVRVCRIEKVLLFPGLLAKHIVRKIVT